MIMKEKVLFIIENLSVIHDGSVDVQKNISYIDHSLLSSNFIFLLNAICFKSITFYSTYFNHFLKKKKVI